MMREMILDVIPMNSGTGQGLNSLATLHEDEYNATVGRKVLFYDPFISKFKMKNVANQQPYIEPCIVGIQKGDIFEVEFEALSVGGKTATFRVLTGELNVDMNPVEGRLTNDVVVNKEEFAFFKVPFIINNTFADAMKGIFFNFRITSSDTELIIKNLRIRFKTSNQSIVIDSNYFTYQNKADFENVIVNKMQFREGSTRYDQTYLNYKNGAIVVDDNGMTVNNTVALFNGIVVEGSFIKNPSCHAVYVEYVNNGNTGLKASLAVKQKIKTTGAKASSVYHNSMLGTTATVKKQILYMPATVTNGTHIHLTERDLLGYTFELGSTTIDGTFILKKVVFGEIIHSPVIEKSPDSIVSNVNTTHAKIQVGGIELVSDSILMNTPIVAEATATQAYTFPSPFKKSCTFANVVNYGTTQSFEVMVNSITATGFTVTVKNVGTTDAAPGSLGVFAMGY